MPTMDTLMNNKAVMLGLSVLAFLVAAVLVITIFRMLMGGRLRMPGGRTRQARLGIVDAFDLDRQRQLIIVRRDNTEHLIMIGGPNDLVIESEIVRAEARDLREPRREPTASEVRIPAPPSGALPPLAVEKPAPRPVDEPRSPVAASTAPSTAPRAPTFPLPPRRPAPAAPLERRPTTPPKLPDSVSRNEEAAAFADRPASPAPAPAVPTPPPGVKPPLSAPPAAAPPIPPAASAAPPAASAASAPTARPPFLKPLPPRPAPPRPLPRANPQPLPGASSPSQPAPGVKAAVPPASAPPTQAAAGSTDALESLEEEMAKLLGRGS
jgi:flagellar protein FliO/FliZ